MNQIEINKKPQSILNCYLFSIFDIITKKSFWISLIIYWIILIASQLLLFLKPNLNEWYFNNLTPYQLSFLTLISFNGIFFGIFGIIRGMNIFVDYKREGTEILLISKPLSRIHIFLSRLLVNLTIALFISIVNFILFTIIVIPMARISNIIYINILTTNMILESSGFIIASTIFPYLFFSLLTGMLGQLLSSRGTMLIALAFVSAHFVANIFTSPNFISMFSLLDRGKILNEKEFLSQINKKLPNANLMIGNNKVTKISNSYDQNLEYEEFEYSRVFSIAELHNIPFYQSRISWSNLYLYLDNGERQYLQSNLELNDTEFVAKEKLNLFIATELSNYLNMTNSYSPKFTFLNFLKFIDPFSALGTFEQRSSKFLNIPSLSNYEYKFSNYIFDSYQYKSPYQEDFYKFFSIIPTKIEKIIPEWSVILVWVAFSSLITYGIYFNFRKNDFN